MWGWDVAALEPSYLKLFSAIYLAEEVTRWIRGIEFNIQDPGKNLVMAKGVCYDTHMVGVDIRGLLGLDGGRLVKMASSRFRESSVRKRQESTRAGHPVSSTCWYTRVHTHTLEEIVTNCSPLFQTEHPCNYQIKYFWNV